MNEIISRDLFEVRTPLFLIGWRVKNIADNGDQISITFENDHGVSCDLTLTGTGDAYISELYAAGRPDSIDRRIKQGYENAMKAIHGHAHEES